MTIIQNFHKHLVALKNFRNVQIDVRTLQKAQRSPQNFVFWQLANDNHAQLAVVNFRIGTNGHTATNVFAIANANHKHATLNWFVVVNCDAQVVELCLGKRIKKRNVVVDFVTALHGFVLQQHVHVHAGANHVQTAHRAQLDVVNVLWLVFQNDFNSLFDVCWMSARTHKIVTRTARNQS